MAESPTETIDNLENDLVNVLSRFKAQVQKELNFVPPKDFNRCIFEMYEKGLFCDFELDIGPDHNPIKVHKLVLLINECTAIEKCGGNSLAIRNVSPEVIKTVVEYFYRRELPLDIKDRNDELLELSKQLGIDSLTKKAKTIQRYCDMAAKCEEVFEPLKSSKRKLNDQSSENVQSPKRLKSELSPPILQSQVSESPRLESQESQPINLESQELKPKRLNSEHLEKELSPKELSCVENAKKTTEITMATDKIPQVIRNPPMQSTSIKSIRKTGDLSMKLINSFVNIGNKNKATPNTKGARHPVPHITNGNCDQNLNFQAIKFIAQAKNTIADVWQSCFVPRESGTNFLVATVGGSLVNWFDLESDCYLSNFFEAPNNKKLRSIAVSVIAQTNKSVIYGVGSNDCVYFFKHPTQKEVTQYDRLDGFNDEVLYIVFNVTSDSEILMYCGTADNKIILWQLKVDANCRIMRNDCRNCWSIDTSFAVLSMVYLKDSDMLISCGESSNILILHGMTNRDIKPVQFTFTLDKTSMSKSISSVVYIAEQNLLAFRYFNHNFIELGFVPALNAKDLMPTRVDRTTRSSESKQSPPNSCEYQLRRAARLELPAKCVAEFIQMDANSNLIGCGDDQGNVLLFLSSEQLKDNRAVIKPHILQNDQWPNNKTVCCFNI